LLNPQVWATLRFEVTAMAKGRQFVTDEKGVKIAVVLDIEEYEKLLEELEDLQAIREYEEAKASGEAPIPLEQALAEIRRNRK
jgi:hypothetical protein